ncbi:hypothetical protein SDC9_80443 [bioreactor metagenome]|uniref:Gliding motility-associated C-terminal domain-containing protein n=1 Tax=bioreactor metagenome TaxID=1076179 RepID=A0A644YZG2_9ZZZZ
MLVDLGADTTVCPGVPVSLDAAQAGATYEWNTAATTGSISVSSPGTYWVIVSQGNCSGSDTIDVFNYPEVIVNLGADRSICPGDEITLDAGNPGATYIWSTGASTQSVVVSADGQYSVFVSMNGCSGDDDIFITMLQDPFVDLGADEVLCEGLTKVLYASFPASDYVWQDGSAYDFYYVTSSGTYSVSVSNSCGTVSDTAEITFIDCDCSVFIPSAFSPTRDEINDKFLPVSTCGWRKFDLMIYNRWGKMLFRSQDGEAGWDGLYDGELVPQGIYTYVLHYTKDTPDNIAEVTYGYVMVLTQP